MIVLGIKPVSVNKAWKGRRFKTPAYKAFERDLLLMLPRKIEIPDGALHLSLMFGFSSKRADIDNPIKLVTDVLQKKYGFNDNRIYKLDVEKTDVAKGHEFIGFAISSYDCTNTDKLERE